MNFLSSARPLFLRPALFLCLFTGAGVARADFLGAFGRLFQKDVDVITVTDVTPAGKERAAATPERPIRYMMLYRGHVSFGNDWAGETIPSKKTVLKWMVAAMRKEGYLLADALHPPEIVLVFGWGMFGAKTGEPEMEGSKRMRILDEGDPGTGGEEEGYGIVGSPRLALHFLGGDKVDLMWEQRQRNFIDPRVLLRGIRRTGVTGKIWDFAESNLFLGMVRAFPMDLLRDDKTPMLWETRFACPATGLRMDQAMPLLITAAAPNLGRETVKPVSVNATRTFGGSINLGDLDVLEVQESSSTAEPAEEP